MRSLRIPKWRADRSATATADAHRDTHVGVVAEVFIRRAVPVQPRLVVSCGNRLATSAAHSTSMILYVVLSVLILAQVLIFTRDFLESSKFIVQKMSLLWI